MCIICVCMFVALSGNLEWVLCCLDVESCQKPIEMLRVLSGATCFMSEFDECDCSGGLRVCVYMCVTAYTCVF